MLSQHELSLGGKSRRCPLTGNTYKIANTTAHTLKAGVFEITLVKLRYKRALYTKINTNEFVLGVMTLIVRFYLISIMFRILKNMTLSFWPIKSGGERALGFCTGF